jgi:hypothetical protein
MEIKFNKDLIQILFSHKYLHIYEVLNLKLVKRNTPSIATIKIIR